MTKKEEYITLIYQNYCLCNNCEKYNKCTEDCLLSRTIERALNRMEKAKVIELYYKLLNLKNYNDKQNLIFNCLKYEQNRSNGKI